MRKLLIALSLVWSANVSAEQPDLLVNHLFENVRIVLSTQVACDNNPIGLRASAQRLDGLYIPGCWSQEPDHPELVRIDWHNGDFSILPMEDFEAVEKR
ncbi:hypothetical protein N8Z09_02735 [Methylophilaceae bacterium]|jgi:hypothetical protein|nr:hypothetical protein [Methylophilaceae bacterium]